MNEVDWLSLLRELVVGLPMIACANRSSSLGISALSGQPVR